MSSMIYMRDGLKSSGLWGSLKGLVSRPFVGLSQQISPEMFGKAGLARNKDCSGIKAQYMVV
jgi:hypothetical protein